MELQEYLEVNKVSVQRMADVTGIPYSTVLSYVNNVSEPSLKNAVKIEEATMGIVSFVDLVKED